MPANLLSCNIGSYGKFRAAAYDHLPSIGVTHVEIAAPALNELDAVKAKLDRHGLSASTVMGKIEIDSDEAGKLFVPTLQAAQALGARVIFVSVHAGERNRQTVYDRLRRVGEEAARFGITIGMETHPDLITNGAVALETMEGINHPNVRVNYDTANIHYYNENVDSLAELGKILDHVGSMHLKDTNGGYKTWFFPAFGKGIVDFKTVFQLLNDRGFYGPFTMEIEGCEGDNLDETQTCQRVADSVAHLRRIGCDV
ncbi:MAG: sugar phosphate isomerase/epimerase [candidate division Zixibacteria bacterium]|nr:sugar phosphate isomerase/epimerase [candidate division Zixibacteria bacterium]